jgi:hypothetical protein
MGKPLFKASDSGQIDILGEREHVTQSELRQGSATGMFLWIKVRPEAFPGRPAPGNGNVCNWQVDSLPLDYSNYLKIFIDFFSQSDIVLTKSVPSLDQ